jgi:tetratricopeptide (TPR) repeat protein
LIPPTRTLAWIYLGLRRFDDATKQFETAMLLNRSIFGDGHTFTHSDAAALGACYGAMDRVTDAHQFLEGFLSAFDAKHQNSSGPASIAYVLCEFGLTLVREGRFAEAEDVLRRAKAQFDRNEIRPLGLRLRPPQRAISGLGQALAGQGKYAEAEPLVVQAFQELHANQRSIICDGPRIVREALDAVISLYRAWRKPEKVAEWQAKLTELPAVQP